MCPEREELPEHLAFGCVLALIGEPILHQAFAGELEQGRAVAWHVEQGEAAACITNAWQVARHVAIDVQQSHLGRVFGARQPCRLPGQLTRSVRQAAFGRLFVAGGDEGDFRRGPVAFQCADQYLSSIAR